MVNVIGNTNGEWAAWHAALEEDTYESQDHPGQWIIFDFKRVRISPTAYLIRSKNMKSWTIEVSNDGLTWMEIDRQESIGEDDIYPSGATFQTDECCEYYRMFRLRQIGKNHSGNDILSIDLFDVFGRVDPPI